jgi:nicotinate-nucleotide pyrophosphorylase (carboxylating)
MDWSLFDEMLEAALAEDCARDDVTTGPLIDPARRVTAQLAAREAGVVCGLALAERLLARFDPALSLNPAVEDGAAVQAGSVAARPAGPAGALLSVERAMLNILQELSGIATLTARYVEAVEGTGARILDTRKTAPGRRLLHKYAVRCGGGRNHRMGLADQALIKDNHLALRGVGREDAAGIREAVRLVRAAHPDVRVEIEVDTHAQLAAVLPARPDIILLDNMTPGRIAEEVAYVEAQCPAGERPELEASGGITLENVRAYALAGVDRISIGALTHSAPALDLGLDIEL